jgi:hypothetical protein
VRMTGDLSHPSHAGLFGAGTRKEYDGDRSQVADGGSACRDSTSRPFVLNSLDFARQSRMALYKCSRGVGRRQCTRGLSLCGRR